MSKVKLQEISKSISSGLTPLRSNSAYWENGSTPWLKTDQLGEKYIYDTGEKISSYALEDTSIKLNPVNSLAIAMYGEGRTRGNISILKSEMTTNQASCNLVIDENKADHEYVYYFLKTQYNQLRNLSSGVRNNLNSNDIKNFEIRLPKNIATQKKIAAVLSALDAKIELNNRINAELESLAKTIYDYWFVQFDFPNADGKPYKSSGGEMVYAEEGKGDRAIPAGWEVKDLGEFGIFKNGVNYDPSQPGDTPAKIVNVRNISKASIFIQNHDLDTINLTSREVNNYLVSDKSILIARSGIPGATRLISDYVKNTIYCGFIICFEVEDPNLKFPLFFFLKKIEKAMNSQSGGTIMKNVNQGTLKSLKILLPKEVSTNYSIKLFNNTIEPIFKKINLIDEENQQLTQLRDWLLPMLMNGQVSIK
jgi:type I restriction enzyme S subunit